MLFADAELAQRIERSETRRLVDGATRARARLGADVMITELGGGVALYVEADSPLDKVVGLGFGMAPSDDELTAIEQAYAQRGIDVRIEVSSLADPELGQRLTRRGYVLEGYENVLGLALSVDERHANADIEARPCTPDEIGHWLDVMVDGFAQPDAGGVGEPESFPRAVLEHSLGDYSGLPGFLSYVARRNGEIVGAACLHMHDAVAHFCGAATLPGHRGHGVQSALLSQRIHDAARAGCDLAVVTTQPGSRSQLNVQRRCFALLYPRAVLTRKSR